MDERTPFSPSRNHCALNWAGSSRGADSNTIYIAGISRGNTDPGSMGLSRGSCVYQPFRPNVSHSMSYPLAILIQVKRDCGIPFFCSSNDGLCVGSTSVVICSLGAKRSRASTSCQTHRTTLRPAKRLAKNCLQRQQTPPPIRLQQRQRLTIIQ